MGCFNVKCSDEKTKARAGSLKTAHGEIATPVFMPVGTAGTVKGITAAQLEQLGAQIMLANTYHLMLRPGVDTVEEIGGLHKFMAWDLPILTDSGGYQVFSLGELIKIDDEGVDFASHVDGAKFRLTPAKATQIQNRLGTDIIMCLDECTPYPCDEARLKKAVERTIDWAGKCKAAHKKRNQLLFGIVQGGIDIELRRYCTAELIKIGFDGYAIGGLSVGEGHDNMIRTVTETTRHLPAEQPRYLMGVGTPADIIAAVAAGVDMFDCVMPTRNGRNAYAFTEAGPLRLRNAAHRTDTAPIEADCDCPCCQSYSRATLRHFFNVGEMLGPILVSIHNIRFYQRLMAGIRSCISAGSFNAWAKEKLEKYAVFNSEKVMNQ